MFWPGEHEPGANHEYELVCKVCGQAGTIRITIDPERHD
jgi:hypothetical protein